MPKRKQPTEDSQNPSSYTFRLANGEAFDVQGVKVLVEQLVYKSIEFTNKKLLEAPAPVVEEVHNEETGGAVREKVKIGRRRYSREEKKHMINLYDKYPVKEAAMEVINSMEGFSKVTAGMVLTWRRPKAPSLKKMGRQVDRNFELEVLRECEKASNNHMQNGGSGNTGSGAVAATLGLTYAVVRECAMNVWERLYPDESGTLVPRWKLNKTTKNLKFSHKWVIGLLRRIQRGDNGMTLAEAMEAGNVNDAIGGYVLGQAGDESDDGSSDDEDEE